MKFVKIGCLLFGVLFVGACLIGPLLLPKGEPVVLSPEEEAFSNANSLIGSDVNGVVHGNTPEAEKAALMFSETMQTAREAFFTKRKKKAKFSMTGGKFLTYCRKNPDSVVFMVHIPDLRKFDQDAKESLAEMAWTMGQLAAKANFAEPPKTLVVGTRGALLWDTVLVGDFLVNADDIEDATTAVKSKVTGSQCDDRLTEFFKVEPAANAASADEPKAEQPVSNEQQPSTPSTSNTEAQPNPTPAPSN